MIHLFFHQRLSLQQLSCFLTVWLVSIATFAEERATATVGEFERFPIEFGEVIRIPVEILGEKHSFVLDSGCTDSVLDAAFRDRLGPVIKQNELETASSIRQFAFYSAPELKIGVRSSQTFRAARPVASMDLSNLRHTTGFQEMGFLGMDFLDSQVVRINADDGFVAFQKAPTSSTAHVETIRMIRGSPRIMIGLSDFGFQSILVDTGSTFCVTLEYKLFNELLDRKRIVLRGSADIAVAGDDSTSRLGVLDHITLGPYQLRNVKVMEGQASVVGLEFLQRFDIELDFPNRRAYFRPGRRAQLPDRWNCAGIWVERVEGRTIVRSVQPRSVAEKCGILKGDLILRVNGISATQVLMAKIRQLRSEPGTELKLSLERDSEVRDVVLKLERQPDPFPNALPAATFRPIPD